MLKPNIFVIFIYYWLLELHSFKIMFEPWVFIWWRLNSKNCQVYLPPPYIKQSNSIFKVLEDTIETKIMIV